MKSTLLSLLLFHTLSLSAQSDTWTYFSPAPQVSCLTAAGNTILAGTDGAGIVRFDTLGNRMYYHTGNSTIPTDTVLQIAMDAIGHWWILHTGGISTYDAATWQTWSITQTGLPANALIRTMKAAPDSSLYVATNNGVAIFKDATWAVLTMANSGLPSDDVWDIAFSPDGKVYFATSGTGVVEQDGSNWTSYTTANTGVSTMNNVYAVTYTSEGVLWAIGGLNPNVLLRLVKLEGGTWTGFFPSDLSITGGGVFKKMNVSDDGNLWLTTSSTVSVLADEVWTHYYQNTDIGCSSAGNSSPAVAGDGQIWIQNTCQLAVFDGQDWYKPGTGLPGPPLGTFYNGITEDAAGGIWMGTEFGQYVTRFQDDVWTQYYPTDQGASNNNVYVINAAPDGAVWFGLDNAEILKYDDGTWSHFDTCASIFTEHITLGAATAPNGDQWLSLFSTSIGQLSTGLAKYSGNGTWQIFTPADVPNLQYAYARNIKFDVNGTAWITTSFKGLIKYDGTTWDTITINNSALPSNRVYDLAFAPDGNLWACTDSGLAVFDGQSWTNITSSNSGLPSDNTYRIAFDNTGSMYVGYSPEVPGATGATVALLRDGVWTTLTPPGWENTVNEQPDAFMVDSQYRLWFAELTDPGVYLYDPMLVHTTDLGETTQPIHLFPNPCPGNCLVTLEVSLRPGMNYRVSNTLGQIVLEVPVSPSNTSTTLPIDVSGLPPGVYWLSLWQEGKLQGRTGFVKI